MKCDATFLQTYLDDLSVEVFEMEVTELASTYNLSELDFNKILNAVIVIAKSPEENELHTIIFNHKLPDAINNKLGTMTVDEMTIISKMAMVTCLLNGGYSEASREEIFDVIEAKL